MIPAAVTQRSNRSPSAVDLPSLSAPSSLAENSSLISKQSSASLQKESQNSSAPIIPAPSVAGQKVSTKTKRRLKLGGKANIVDPDLAEFLTVAIILNFCFVTALKTDSIVQIIFYVLVANIVVLRTLNLRALRAKQAAAKLEEALSGESSLTNTAVTATAATLPQDTKLVSQKQRSGSEAALTSSISNSSSAVATVNKSKENENGKLNPGFFLCFLKFFYWEDKKKMNDR